METKLFRKVALDRLSSPEQLDEVMQITTPKGWLALIALALLIAAIVLWGLLGTVPITVSGTGVFTREGAFVTVSSPAQGQLKLLVDLGATVDPGQVIAVVGTSQISSPIAGRVLRFFADDSSDVAAGATLLAVESTDDETNPLEVVVFVPPVDGARLSAGMEVQIAPASVHREEFGFILGVVSAVNSTPSSAQRIIRLVDDPEFAAQMTSNGAPIEVRLMLTRAETPSGYKWASSTGPNFKLQSGTFADATIIVGQQRPISLIFGFIQLAMGQ
jgi:hypothetical protein